MTAVLPTTVVITIFTSSVSLSSATSPIWLDGKITASLLGSWYLQWAQQWGFSHMDFFRLLFFSNSIIFYMPVSFSHYTAQSTSLLLSLNNGSLPLISLACIVLGWGSLIACTTSKPVDSKMQCVNYRTRKITKNTFSLIISILELFSQHSWEPYVPLTYFYMVAGTCTVTQEMQQDRKLLQSKNKSLLGDCHQNSCPFYFCSD